MYERLCIPVVGVCWNNLETTILFSSDTQTLSHLTWDTLENGNFEYNDSTGEFQACFSNVTGSFLFLEYCEVSGRCDSRFCCNIHDEFVSRTCVHMAGGRGKL